MQYSTELRLDYMLQKHGQETQEKLILFPLLLHYTFTALEMDSLDAKIAT